MASAIHQYESAIDTHVSPHSWISFPPPSPPHPSRLSQSTGFGFPASYIKLPLAICFTYGKCIYFLASNLTVCVILCQVNLTNTWGLEVFFSLFS